MRLNSMVFVSFGLSVCGRGIMGGMQFVAAKLNGLKNHVNTAKSGEDG